MRRRNQKYGIVTACVGGGQGVAGIYELLNRDLGIKISQVSIQKFHKNSLF
jgi:Thiolase, C-terminal domain